MYHKKIKIMMTINNTGKCLESVTIYYKFCVDMSDLACDILFVQIAAPKKEENLTYGPDESCLHWSGGLIYVVAIETKPCLQPKTVPRTETGQLHLAISQKLLRQLHHFGLRDRDLGHRDTVYGAGSPPKEFSWK